MASSASSPAKRAPAATQSAKSTRGDRRGRRAAAARPPRIEGQGEGHSRGTRRKAATSNTARRVPGWLPSLSSLDRRTLRGQRLVPPGAKSKRTRSGLGLSGKAAPVRRTGKDAANWADSGRVVEGARRSRVRGDGPYNHRLGQRPEARTCDRPVPGSSFSPDSRSRARRHRPADGGGGAARRPRPDAALEAVRPGMSARCRRSCAAPGARRSRSSCSACLRRRDRARRRHDPLPAAWRTRNLDRPSRPGCRGAGHGRRELVGALSYSIGGFSKDRSAGSRDRGDAGARALPGWTRALTAGASARESRLEPVRWRSPRAARPGAVRRERRAAALAWAGAAVQVRCRARPPPASSEAGLLPPSSRRRVAGPAGLGRSCSWPRPGTVTWATARRSSRSATPSMGTGRGRDPLRAGDDRLDRPVAAQLLQDLQRRPAGRDDDADRLTAWPARSGRCRRGCRCRSDPAQRHRRGAARELVQRGEGRRSSRRSWPTLRYGSRWARSWAASARGAARTRGDRARRRAADCRSRRPPRRHGRRRAGDRGRSWGGSSRR